MEFEENFAPKPVADLIDGKHHFVIPSFQRGYRWEEKQVTDLLEDIKQFAGPGGAKSDSYFLQPVVVKTVKDKKDTFEVIDGQQRLTTLLLILKRIMRRLGEDERETYMDKLYDISYTNRPQLDFNNPVAVDNIDSYYLAEAKRVIDTWFNTQTEKKQNLNNFVASLLYDQEQQVKIIWYAIDENSTDLVSINIFNRLNKGKIPLTSSELIKALFIMDYDIRKENSGQLSMEWNEMERRFLDDKFWFFVSNGGKDTQTRIDVLFDFVTRRDKNEDSDHSYREFQKLYDFCRKSTGAGSPAPSCGEWAAAKEIQSMQDAWKEVRTVFDRLVAWYEDNLFYHYVGYLVAIGASPIEISNRLEEEKNNRKAEEPSYEWTVKDTERSFCKLIMSLGFKRKKEYLKKDDIDAFEYNIEYKDLIRRLLLLFNVESCRKGQNVRFSFSRYKKDGWDIEHVEPQNDAAIQSYADRMLWIKNVAFILKFENSPNPQAPALLLKCNELHDKFEKAQSINEKEFKELYQKVNDFYSGDNTENKDLLGNLTLLDGTTNKEYKDAPFAYKRYCIVNQDKAGKRYILPCTRNLFLKYYSDSNKESSYLDMMRWNASDRKGYMAAIHEMVDPIFDSVQQQ